MHELEKALSGYEFVEGKFLRFEKRMVARKALRSGEYSHNVNVRRLADAWAEPENIEVEFAVFDLGDGKECAQPSVCFSQIHNEESQRRTWAILVRKEEAVH